MKKEWVFGGWEVRSEICVLCFSIDYSIDQKINGERERENGRKPAERESSVGLDLDRKWVSSMREAGQGGGVLDPVRKVLGFFWDDVHDMSLF